MATSLKQVVGGGGTGFKLAPDLTWPSEVDARWGYKDLTIPLSVGVYNTALSLTGKFSIGLIKLDNAVGQFDVKLTVDGILIWDGGQITPNPPQDLALLGNTNTLPYRQYITCDSSLLLEIRPSEATSCTLLHDARPIL